MLQRLTPIVVQAPQRSEEWYKARLGNVTASEVSKTMSYYAVRSNHLTKADEFYALNPHLHDQEWLQHMREMYPTEYCLQAEVELLEASERRAYREDIVAERITGISVSRSPFVTEDMRWGIIQEINAKALYGEVTGNDVKDAPLMLHPKLLCGASPDALVIDVTTGELGNLEAKCLRSANHLYKVIETNEVPAEYRDQIQMQMWIDGRDWCDFIAYDKRVVNGLRLFIKRVEFDEFYVENVMVPAVTRFLDECDRDERKFYAIAKQRREEAEAARAELALAI